MNTATGNPQNLRLQIKRIIDETPDARSFVMEPLLGGSLTYEAGQFLTFVFYKRNGEEARRNYSISSAPLLREPLQITVKRVENGEFSRKLIAEAKAGDILESIGASGFFTLPAKPERYNTYFFFAAGSGIAPVYPLISTLLHLYARVKIILVYSNASIKETIFLQKIQALQSTYAGRFETVFFFSDADAIQEKRLSAFRTEQLLQQYAAGEKNDSLFYLCGPFEYMRMIGIVLLSNGVFKNQIRKEIFNIEKPVRNPQPPDTDEHNVQIQTGKKNVSLQVRYPQTILQAALKKGILLPYSCESGQCGTCAATCVSGKVWMWRNDVLMEEETAKGRVLTCTGYPVGGDVQLRY